MNIGGTANLNSERVKSRVHKTGIAEMEGNLKNTKVYF